MGPPALPAYSLRVQLFSPLSYGSDDRPQRNFRVVASPEMTVREFCMEASRIHEINYGYSLVIKKVQDDQAFDVTQSEILGNLFSASSIIRVVQASKHPGIRDSIPPTSALRFDPTVTRKKRRHLDDEVTESVSSQKPNKRQRFFEIDPDNPLPSRESDTTPPPGYLSHAQVVNVMKRFGVPSKYNLRKSTLQVSETPEHLSSFEFQKSKIPEDPSTLALPNLPITPDYRPVNIGLRCINRKDFCQGESVESSANSNSLQIENRNSRNSSYFSPNVRSMSLGQNHAHDSSISVNSSQETLSAPETRKRNRLSSLNHKSLSAENIKSDELNRINQIDKKTDSKSQKSHSDSANSENCQEKNSTSPDLCDLKLEAQTKPRNESLDCHPGSCELNETYLEEGSKSEENCLTHHEIIQRQNKSEEERPSVAIEETEKLHNTRKRTYKISIQNNNQTQNTISTDACSMQESKVQQERVVDKINVLPISTKGERSQSQEIQHAEKNYEKRLTINKEKEKAELQKPSLSDEKSREELKLDSQQTPNLDQAKHASPALLKSSSKNSQSSSIVPPRNGKIIPALKSSQAESSPPPQSSSLEKTPSGEHHDHSISSIAVRKVSFLENDKKETPIKPPTRTLPNASVICENKGSTRKNSQRTSFTPILPPKKVMNSSVHVTAREGCKIMALDSKVTPITKILPPTKVTPVLPPKKHLSITPKTNKKNSPISNFVAKDTRSARSPSKIQNLKNKTSLETRKSSGYIDGSSCAVPNHNGSANHQKAPNSSSGNQPQSMVLGPTQNQKRESEDWQDHTDVYETDSQNSIERDSRSPVAFYHNSQLSKTHQTSTISSTDSQSEDEDSPELESDEDHENTKLELDKLNSSSRIKSNSGAQSSSKHQIILPDSKEDISKVQVPNSSPPVNLSTLPNRFNKSNTAENLHQEAQSSPLSTPVYGSTKDPSSSDTRKPQFGFGASLSAIHRSGGLVGMPNPNLKPNTQKNLAVQLEANGVNLSGSESSDTESSSSEDGDEFENTSIRKPSISVPIKDRNQDVESNSDSEYNSNSDSEDPDVKERLTEQEAKDELFAKINDLTKSSYKSKAVDMNKNNTRNRSNITSSQNTLSLQSQSDAKVALTGKRSSNTANKYTQGYVFSQPTL